MSLKQTWENSFAALQKIGKALMLPVSVLILLFAFVRFSRMRRSMQIQIGDHPLTDRSR